MDIHRKLRMGMIGGGVGSFIGVVHRMAATLDNEIELVCGAFSSDPLRSKQSGLRWYLPESRIYGSFEEMISREKELPEGERMDFVSIVTPNHLHFLPAKLALENGFHVVCDKPMTYSLQEAYELEDLVKKTGLLFALTHNYTGYPMIKQARKMVQEGKLGRIRKVIVEYLQGWLSTKAESTGNRQAEWRTDPARSGIAGCMGDIGIHAENLCEYVTGQKISEVCSDLNTIVEGRLLDDDGSVLIRLEGGAKGILYASQICAGEENGLRIRIYGEKGGLEWSQMEPNTLWVKWTDKPVELYRTGTNFKPIYSEAKEHVRIPAGHPEGFLEAFANIYRNFAIALRARMEGKEAPEGMDFPTVHDGVRGMQFLETVVKASASPQKWMPFITK